MQLYRTSSVLAVVEAHRGDVPMDDLAHRVEAAGEMTYAAAARALGRLREREVVSDRTADRILTALDLHYLWHELVEAGPG